MDAKLGKGVIEYDQLRRTIFYPKTDVAHDATLYPALRSQLDQNLHEWLPVVHDICMSRWGYLPAHITPLASGGTFHLLYKIEYGDQSFVIRLNRLKDHRASWEFLIDAWVYPKLFSLGLPGPSVIAIDCSRTICPTEYQILSYVQGHQLSVFQDQATQHMSPALLQAIGAYVAQVHSVQLAGFGPLSIASLHPSIRLPYPVRGECSAEALVKAGCIESMNSLASRPLTLSFRPSSRNLPPNPSPSGIHTTWQDYIFLRLDEHIDVCVSIKAITVHEATIIQKIFSSHTKIFDCSPPVLLHGDLGNHNFLSHDGVSISALIDWEDCMSGDPVFDIAFWGTFFRDHMLNDFLMGYRQHAQLPDDFEVRYWLYFLRIALSKTVHRFRFGYQDHPSRPPASLRIQRALENIKRLQDA